MAHFATDIDFKRIEKSLRENVVSYEELKGVYREGHFVVSDLNPISFAYPVKYADGLLIKHYTKSYNELLDMCSLFCDELKSKLYLANVEKKIAKKFSDLGFIEKHEVLKLYKMLVNVKEKNTPYKFVGYDNSSDDDIEGVHKRIFGFSFVGDKEIIKSPDNKTFTRLCYIGYKCVGYYSFKINTSILYGYIIKIVIDDNSKEEEIRDAIVNDLSLFLIKRGITFIFLDASSDESLNFFRDAGFNLYNRSYLLIKDDEMQGNII